MKINKFIPLKMELRIWWSGLVCSALSDFNIQLPSLNGSYQFLSLEVGKPAINGRDEQDFFIYTLNIKSKLEV